MIAARSMQILFVIGSDFERSLGTSPSRILGTLEFPSTVNINSTIMESKTDPLTFFVYISQLRGTDCTLPIKMKLEIILSTTFYSE